jgi:hypothetical protein
MREQKKADAKENSHGRCYPKSDDIEQSSDIGPWRCAALIPGIGESTRSFGLLRIGVWRRVFKRELSRQRIE